MRNSLLGGASANEGLVEVCVGDFYLPVSLDDGRFSVREATVICTELNEGLPYGTMILRDSYLHTCL